MYHSQITRKNTTDILKRITGKSHSRKGTLKKRTIKRRSKWAHGRRGVISSRQERMEFENQNVTCYIHVGIPKVSNGIEPGIDTFDRDFRTVFDRVPYGIEI